MTGDSGVIASRIADAARADEARRISPSEARRCQSSALLREARRWRCQCGRGGSRADEIRLRHERKKRKLCVPC